jgi:cation transport regulator ChaB
MEDIPEEVRKTLTFHTVSTLDEVFAIALEPEAGQGARTEPTLMEEAEEHGEVHATV